MDVFRGRNGVAIGLGVAIFAGWLLGSGAIPLPGLGGPVLVDDEPPVPGRPAPAARVARDEVAAGLNEISQEI